MTRAELDARILQRVGSDWRKVAFIVASIGQEAGIAYETVAQRLAYLVEMGKLDSQGDISNWRFSEVRRRL